MNGDQDPTSRRDHDGAPLHVGIIMDGNGRWAAQRGLPRIEGHRRGVEALRQAVRAAPDFGIRYLTLYSFSTENWTRPPQEVSDLMTLLKRFIRNDLAELHSHNVRVKVIGLRNNLANDIGALLREAEDLTRHNSGLTLVIAFNYGSRQEIAQAAKLLAEKVASGRIAPDDITPTTLANHLDTAGLPDPDLIIRTSGERRLSNFLLWQAAYAELAFLPIYWPDFDRAAFAGALADYAHRERRFGGVAAPLAAKTGS
ncbi:MAG: undecaprenyl diphosphate synthase [Methylobacteriaceae bacterium]|nr:undecaprenyl diphosphate synthase [Methylobacteriaceae bacterium]